MILFYIPNVNEQPKSSHGQLSTIPKVVKRGVLELPLPFIALFIANDIVQTYFFK